MTAVPDRCVHRRFPLSQAPSRLVDDQVVCGYHGFTYASDGKCVAVPGQSRIPRTARLLPYPLVEQDSLRVGVHRRPRQGRRLAHPSGAVPRLAGPSTVRGMEPLRARFSLLVDNLLDLSHETYLHGGYIGTPEVAATPITTEVDDEAGIVYVSRHMDDAECPPFYARSTGLQGRIARWQDIEYTPPCLYLLHSRIAPVGSVPNPDGTDPDAFHVEVVYAITPETENSTHDFWAVARDFALEDQEVSTFLAENNRTVVLQDVGGARRPRTGHRHRARRLPGAVDQHRHGRPRGTSNAPAHGPCTSGCQHPVMTDLPENRPRVVRPACPPCALGAGRGPAPCRVPLRSRARIRRADRVVGLASRPPRRTRGDPPRTTATAGRSTGPGVDLRPGQDTAMTTEPHTEHELDLVLERKETIADGVVRLTLRHPDGASLPGWKPGAHVDLVLTDEHDQAVLPVREPA